MKNKFLIIVLIAIGILFHNCGFKPMHKISDDNENIRNYSIKILNEVSREIEQEVSSIVFSKAETTYEVLVNVQEDQTPLIVNTNGTVAKYRIEVSINFEIKQNDSNDTIATGVTRGFAQYDVSASEINNEDTKKSMTKTAAKNALQIMISKIESSIARSNDN